jgi:hypothetical protein
MNMRRNSLNTSTDTATLEAKVMMAAGTSNIATNSVTPRAGGFGPSSAYVGSAAAQAIGQSFDFYVTTFVAKRLAKKSGFSSHDQYIAYARNQSGKKNFHTAVNNFIENRAKKTGKTILEIQTKFAQKEKIR